MPRPPRLALAGVPLHVVQRGADRRMCFHDDVDRQLYLGAMSAAKKRTAVSIHAYVLMGNHVHLLVTPRETGSVSGFMQSIGRTYVPAFNERHGRVGTLWEGRFKSISVADERYLLACMRYIELNPVRAGLSAAPENYAWSSFHANALGHWNPLLERHTVYQALGNDDAMRRRHYRELFEISLVADDLSRFRKEATRRGRPSRKRDLTPNRDGKGI